MIQSYKEFKDDELIELFNRKCWIFYRNEPKEVNKVAISLASMMRELKIRELEDVARYIESYYKNIK